MSDDRFNVDWKAPLSAMQAFGVALSAFDSKLACAPAPPASLLVIAVSRFCRTLATLLVSGVPIISALGIVKDVVGNVIIQEAVESASKNIQEGQSIAAPLKKSGQFPPMVIHMIAIGERTGELESMLVNVADAYESEVDATIEGLTGLLGPLMIVAMGGAVFFVALGMLLPLANLTSQFQ